VLPLTQSMVPPLANVDAGSGFEDPPVLPPVHPLIVMVPVAVPLIDVHLIVTAAPATPPFTATTDNAETGIASAAAISKTRRIVSPSLSS
jgi:hypothetical protein